MMSVLEYLSGSFDALLLAVLTLSLLIGSFLNVVILRMPIMMFRGWKQECQGMEGELPDHPAINDLSKPYNLVTPASHCPSCSAPVKPWMNIPVISWIFLRGKCASCGTRIGLRYPLVEIATALMSGLLLLKFEWGWPLLAMLVFTWLLITMSVIDIDHKILPDTLTLGLLWLGLLLNTQGMFTDLQSAVLGAALGYGVLWGFFWVFKLLTGKDGMGYGDFKLLAALGAWFGFQSLLTIIIMSSVVGAVVGIAGVIVLGRDRQVPIPFGPYLAMAGWIVAMWGNEITQWYFSVI
ncbi:MULTISPECIES: prepilin peptidase [Thalassolituus]|uniref:prepilin peptidase n=3 Tax=Oceanospirillaceae TaxID=135620 RepID=UPI0026475710|nr:MULTISPECIES: A24 family peptidase [Thalassolituus]|tara:strand:- start:29271 stop:30152 length:882 start_codon:yes stop_codon:yes gene_type:complete